MKKLLLIFILILFYSCVFAEEEKSNTHKAKFTIIVDTLTLEELAEKERWLRALFEDSKFNLKLSIGCDNRPKYYNYGNSILIDPDATTFGTGTPIIDLSEVPE